jgi:ligand-binding sensor domain-containing protein
MGREPRGITFWNDSLETWRFYEARYHSDINSDNVFCITGNQRFIFFGTDLGLARYDKKRGTWSALLSINRLRNAKIHDLKFMRNRLYIATDQGLYWMFPSSSSIEHVTDTRLKNLTVYKIAAMDNHLLLSTPHGLYSYTPQTDRFSLWQTRSALPDFRFRTVAVQNSDIWLAGRAGVAYFNSRSKNWTSFTQLQYQLDADYYDIAFTGNTIWFATGKGLLKYDKRRQFWYRYTTRDGLASNRVFHVDVAGDYLWLSTQKGVTIFRWYRDNRQE